MSWSWLLLACSGTPSTDPTDATDPEDPTDPIDPTDPEDPTGTDDPTSSADGIGVLGFAAHDVSARLEVVAGRADGLDHPTDLAFEPTRPGELWVVNRTDAVSGDDSVVILDRAGEGAQSAEKIVDPYALHFMENVSSMAMGAPDRFGTCQESRNSYNDQARPNDFMGPSLWSTDRDVFGFSNPEAVDYLTDLYGVPVDLGSHLDMLHQSPLCMGIAWDSRSNAGGADHNVYWVFDGLHSAIVRYDFQEDHGPGYDDHSDGIIARWVEGEVSRVAGVPSHLELDPASGLLYVADTGNDRIAVLDTGSGSRGRNLVSRERDPEHYEWVGADLRTLVDGAELGMAAPSGLALVDGLLFVTDAGTGRIHAFDLDGNELDWAETGRTGGALAGIVAPSADELWLVDARADEILVLRSPAVSLR